MRYAIALGLHQKYGAPIGNNYITYLGSVEKIKLEQDRGYRLCLVEKLTLGFPKIIVLTSVSISAIITR
jgi:hypothetical protein